LQHLLQRDPILKPLHCTALQHWKLWTRSSKSTRHRQCHQFRPNPNHVW